MSMIGKTSNSDLAKTPVVIGTTTAIPSDNQNNDWIWVATGASLGALIIMILAVVCCVYKCRNSADEEERVEYEQNL